MTDKPPFKIVRTNGHDEGPARAAYEKDAELYLRNRIAQQQRTWIVEKSKPD